MASRHVLASVIGLLMAAGGTAQEEAIPPSIEEMAELLQKDEGRLAGALKDYRRVIGAAKGGSVEKIEELRKAKAAQAVRLAGIARQRRAAHEALDKLDFVGASVSSLEAARLNKEAEEHRRAAEGLAAALVADHVPLLEHDDVSVRDLASSILVALGPAGLPALRGERTDEKTEGQLRLRDVIETLEGGGRGIRVATDKPVYAPDQAITVTVRGMPGNATDWVTLIGADAPDDQYGVWFYTSGRKEGTLQFPGLPAGTYEARVFLNWPEGAFVVAGRRRFVVRP